VWHEVGHGLDHILGTGDTDFSTSKEFVDAYEKDLASPQMAGRRSALSYFLQDGAAGPSEAMAEAVAKATDPADTSGSIFEQGFPNVMRLVRGKIAQFESAPPSTPYKLSNALMDLTRLDNESVAYLNYATFQRPELMAKLDPSLQKDVIANVITSRKLRMDNSLSELLGRRFQQSPSSVAWLVETAGNPGPVQKLAFNALLHADTPVASEAIGHIVNEQLNSADGNQQSAGLQSLHHVLQFIHQNETVRKGVLQQEKRLSELATSGQSEEIRKEAAWDLRTVQNLRDEGILHAITQTEIPAFAREQLASSR
jgi:hypothetical protein